MGMIRVVSLIVPLLVGTACANEAATQTMSKLQLTEIRVGGNGADEPDAFCKEFHLSNENAVIFFQRSRTIDMRILHDDYDYLPCYVRGTAMRGAQSCQWEIRAGGTAEVDCGKKHYILACDACEEFLK